MLVALSNSRLNPEGVISALKKMNAQDEILFLWGQNFTHLVLSNLVHDHAFECWQAEHFSQLKNNYQKLLTLSECICLYGILQSDLNLPHPCSNLDIQEPALILKVDLCIITFPSEFIDSSTI